MPEPARRRYPWKQSLLAGIVGLCFFLYDDFRPEPKDFQTDWFEWVELAFMSPGLALATWYLFSYLHLREDGRDQALAQQQDERFLLLGRFAGAVAHEIRNPLHNANLLLEALPDADASTRDDLTQRLRGNLKRIDVAVNLVYLLARRDGEIPSTECDLAALLRQIHAESPTANTKPILWEIPEIARIRCAPDGLRIILDNLLQNAVKAAPAGAITLRLRCEGLTQWRLTVINPGTAPAWLLDPLCPVPPGGGGLGLGLSISRHLASQLGLSLTFTESDGQVHATLTQVATP